MPLGRERRQQMQGRARAATKQRPRQPSVDTFGTIKFPGGGEARVRLIEYAENKLAAFSEANITDPATFEVQDMNIKGRLLTAQLVNDGSEIKFQKAGCGCETPHNLRGGRNKLLRDAGLEEPAAPTEPTAMEALLQQHAPGAFVPLEGGETVTS